MVYYLILLTSAFLFMSCGELFNVNTLPTNYKLAAPFSAQLGLSRAGTAGTETIQSVVADSTGNSYYAGATTGSLGETTGGSNDILIKKVNSSGSIVWIKQIGLTTITAFNTANATAYSAIASDYARGIALDSQGNIIVGACTYGSLAGTNAGGNDAVLLKLNSATGDVMLMKQFGTETETAETFSFAGDDCGEFGDFMDQIALAVDSSDNIFMTTMTTSNINEVASAYDFYVAKLDSSFNFQWLKQYGSVSVAAHNAAYSAAGNQFSADLVLDRDGHPFVAAYGGGGFAGVAQGLHEFIWTKLDKDTGVIQWIHQLGGVNWDVMTSAALASDGNFILGGYSGSDNLFGDGEVRQGSWDLTVFKVNASTGSIMWGKSLGTNAALAYSKDFSKNDQLMDVISHSNGNIYAVGFTTGDVSEPNSILNGQDAWIASFNSSTGSLLSFKQYGSLSFIGPASPVGDDMARTITEGVAGNIYIGGSTTGDFLAPSGGSTDAWYLGFNPEFGLP
ncbi:MAG: PQQ-like beta-propeller repeat protein [Bdellovibrionales bacterium]|nr:PQQ-like beta-propeller repeat protein [Bdellovibrionales bacterium]